MEKLIWTLMIFLNFFSGINCLAVEIQVPHFAQILQMEHDRNLEKFKTFNWGAGPGRLNVEHISVISRPEIIEIGEKEGRSFQVNYIYYALLYCDESKHFKKTLGDAHGEVRREKFNIAYSKTQPSKLWINMEEVENKNGPLTPGPSALLSGDGNGMNLVIYIDELIAKPNAVDLDKLCKGQPAKNRAALEAAIAHNTGIWKAAGVGKGK